MKPKSHLGLIFFKILFPLRHLIQVLGEKFNEIAHIRLVDLLPRHCLDLRVVDGEMEFEEAYGTKRQSRDLVVSAVVKEAEGGIGVIEIDPDPFLSLKIIFEPVALILCPFFIKDLFYLARVILHLSIRGFHLFHEVEDPALLWRL